MIVINHKGNDGGFIWGGIGEERENQMDSTDKINRTEHFTRDQW